MFDNISYEEDEQIPFSIFVLQVVPTGLSSLFLGVLFEYDHNYNI